MKKISQDAALAFMQGKNFKRANTEVYISLNNRIVLSLFGNPIAFRELGSNSISIRSAGWSTVTTKDRLNALPGVNIKQKNYQWYLNGGYWNGELQMI